jgi:hypothetical protein
MNMKLSTKELAIGAFIIALTALGFFQPLAFLPLTALIGVLGYSWQQDLRAELETIRQNAINLAKGINTFVEQMKVLDAEIQKLKVKEGLRKDEQTQRRY